VGNSKPCALLYLVGSHRKVDGLDKQAVVQNLGYRMEASIREAGGDRKASGCAKSRILHGS